MQSKIEVKKYFYIARSGKGKVKGRGFGAIKDLTSYFKKTIGK